MFDTHCHLNFKAFKKTLPEVIDKARSVGVTHIVVPGTDVKTSKKAVEIVQNQEHIYAAVGIHPHHVMKYQGRHDELDSASENKIPDQVRNDVHEIELLLSNPKVVAVGEIGMDKHEYQTTVYESYEVDGTFLELQQELLQKQITLAKKYKKTLILHNREAKDDLLTIVEANWDSHFQKRSVFHCCEPDEELLRFAKNHQMFIGVDGDITYSKEKEEFIKKVPLEMLVLETDSPFLLPEPLKSERKFPNNPANMVLIAQKVSEVKGLTIEKVKEATFRNAQKLFNLS